MKHGSTTAHLKQKYRQLSGQQLVKAVQSDQKLNSGLVKLWLSAEIKKKTASHAKEKSALPPDNAPR